VRIPIERAMELIAQRGLPVAPAVEQAPLMTGDDEAGMVAAPLTNGFARTGYEQDQGAGEAAERRKQVEVRGLQRVYGFPPISQRGEMDGNKGESGDVAGVCGQGTMRKKLARRGDGRAARFTVRWLHARPSLLAQVSRYGDKQMGPVNDKPPAILNGVGIAQNLNEQLPLGSPSPTTRASRCNWPATSASGRRFWRWSTTSARCCARKS
jgi:hypothetical protein